MKHILFPTAAAADAFTADLQAQGVIAPTMGSSTYTRRSAATGVADRADGPGSLTMDGDGVGGTPEDAGAGAVKGTGVGAVVGAAAGILATGATIATGGLALPVILGMTALGSGVGAAVGATGGAMGVDETGKVDDRYDVDDTYYDRMDSTINSGGRVVAVHDSVPQDVLMDAVARHGGEIVDSGARRVDYNATM
ncbi:MULTISPECIES: hypothetical protein [Deinococcus]|uniref:Uncharacterized protein n=1 Tax=Deinococcus daejeonensis TaxID=1007098 RepID=A0ABQ2JBV0_9DEIO|nr:MULTISPECIES: hypothetical protein [Deinococcus]RIY04118.1 hypothetical protein D3W47_12330 [Deinococcus sp. RM]GGN41840.1 hypothetical protein GCM10010842_27860 [Deinococcus daejeonensis]